MLTVTVYIKPSLRIGFSKSRRSSGLAKRSFRTSTRAWSCCKMLIVPLEVFSLLAMGRVTRELRTSIGEAAIDKARMRIVNRDADNIIDRCWKMRTIPDFVAHYICGDEREYTSGKLW